MKIFNKDMWGEDWCRLFHSNKEWIKQIDGVITCNNVAENIS